MFWENLFWLGMLLFTGLIVHFLAVRALQNYGIFTVIAVSLVFVGSKVGRAFLAETLGIVLE